MSKFSDVELQQLADDLPRENLPNHVALIMDGNGRWAKKHRRPRIFGHRRGVVTAKSIANFCQRLQHIRYLTLYAFSTENWIRPRAEVSALMRLLKEFLRQETDDMVRKGVRFLTIGDTHRLPGYAQKELQKTKDATAHNSEFHLILALNYGSRDEIHRAVIRAMEQKVPPEKILAEGLSDYLDTKGIPDPDLLIRTSGEMRISNYLLYQLAYSELVFTDVFWPDFTEDKFCQSLREYQGRARRFGGVK